MKGNRVGELIPSLPPPSKVTYSTFFGIEAKCPWCGVDTQEWDSERGGEHDADCCGKPVFWDLETNLTGQLRPMRTEADKRYIEMKKPNPLTLKEE